MTTSAGMRLLFLLLLLANVMFFVYADIVNVPEDAASQIGRLQMHPEKIKLIAKGDAIKAQTGSQGETPAKMADACLEWGLFAGPAVARADAAIDRLQLAPDIVQRVVVDAGAYWVYIPPVKNKAEMDRAVEDLKARRVSDFFVVQDPPQWRNSISLGTFITEDAAQGLLSRLRNKGVHNAVLERREDFLKQVAYYVREPSVAMVARLADLQRDFPGTEVRARPCPAANQQ